MKKSDLVYYEDGFEIIQDTWENFVNEYGADETTTPRGVANREFVNSYDITLISNCPEDYDEDETSGVICPELPGFSEEIGEFLYNTPGEYTVYILDTWGFGGNFHEILEVFETKEEAEEALFQMKEIHLESRLDRIPHWSEDKSCIEKSIAEIVEGRLYESYEKNGYLIAIAVNKRTGSFIDKGLVIFSEGEVPCVEKYIRMDKLTWQQEEALSAMIDYFNATPTVKEEIVQDEFDGIAICESSTNPEKEELYFLVVE